MADCDPMTEDRFVFPRRPAYRAALDRIGYRVGDYGAMREAMIRHIDRQVELAGWTHRGDDDPAIALIGGAAVIGDILSFYQERYANEAFLRTATWRESVADLVRLTGYRLAPALGGLATIAVLTKPGKTVLVPRGFPVKADLEGASKPGEFETTTELVALPHLSDFRLYRPRIRPATAPEGSTRLEIESAGGSTAAKAIRHLDLKQGDRLLLLPPPPAWESAGSAFTAEQDKTQVLKVEKVETVLDRTIVTFETPLAQGWTRPIRAFRLGRTFRHFGHAAPPTYTTPISTGNEITGAREVDTGFARHIDEDHVCELSSCSMDLPARRLPLDIEVPDLAANSRVIVETRVKVGSTTRRLAVLRTITGMRSTTLGFGPLNAAATLVTLGTPLIRHTDLDEPEADVRDYRIHEVAGPEIVLRPQATWPDGAIASGTDALSFYGTRDEVRDIAGRRVALIDADRGLAEVLTCVNERGDFSGGGADTRMWPLSFDAPPRLFVRGDFPEAGGAVQVHANLVDVDEGRTQDLAAIGSGDGRARFQTFALAKPLTYHLGAAVTPPQVPELTVYVAGQAWQRVSSFFGQSPDAQVYIVREDADGQSWVQFGDGETGARLPSGKDNVSAVYRTGSGARGPIKDGAKPAQVSRDPAIADLVLAGEVHGGTVREDAANAAAAAPGKVQGLGRLVSLADYETELLSVPGVERVRADWDMGEGTPAIVLSVLMASGRESEFAAVRDVIARDQRCRGPNRHIVRVERAYVRHVWMDLRYGLDPRYPGADVEAAIRAVIAPMDDAADSRSEDHGKAARDGLFAGSARRLGAAEYASRVEGRVNAVAGVAFAALSGFGIYSADVSRAAEIPVPPAAPRPRAARLVPARNELLALRSSSLTITAVPAGTSGDCA